ncbi:MAG: 3-oxoadipyl-CoA thiolase [Gammaproteobacteria bacterium]|nr:MAG: 3-oxoadipyl-CoA thiolase [Gammaproteobacteria bacterium]
MKEAYIIDYVRTAFGRYGGALASVRPDDLGAIVLADIKSRFTFDAALIDDCLFGCANQAGEDNRNVARMSLLLAGYPEAVPGTTVNRLCGSGMDTIGMAARAIKAGDADLVIAGGVESMSRAPFVMPKAEAAFSRSNAVYDTTIGWRFPNPLMQAQFGVETMPETAENVAQDFNISRQDQDAFAAHSQAKTEAARERLAKEIVPVTVKRRKQDDLIVDRDEHPRPGTTVEVLAKLRPLFKDGTVTAGNASGVNDGAAALLLASEEAVQQYGLKPKVKVLGMAACGVEPRIMGVGPIAATERLLKRLNLTMDDFAIIELNEAFASQALATIRHFGIEPTDARLNPNGGAISLGHPLGASGARITGSAMVDIADKPAGTKALATMCIGVGQGIAIALETV